MQEKMKDTGSLSVGDILYEARISTGESIETISKKLRIQPFFLEALEKNDDSVFPGKAFQIGFLKAYAQYLNLDPKDLSTLIKKDFQDSFAKPNLYFPKITPEKMFPSKRIVYLSIFILLFLGTNFSFHNSIPPAQEKAEPVREPAQEKREENIAQNTPIQTQQPKTEDYHETHDQSPYAQLKALGKCWIEIRQKEKGIVFDKMLEVGEKFEIEFSPDKTLKIGNAGGIEIMMNGQPSGPLGEKGDVISSIPLDSKEKFLDYIQSLLNR